VKVCSFQVSLPDIGESTVDLMNAMYTIMESHFKGYNLWQVSSFFFLELRRRAASHFIKIEKKVHREGESPQTKYQTHPHTYKTLHTQNKERPDHRAPNLRWCYKRPGKQLFELRSSSQAPQGAFICYGLQEHLGVRENTFKHARISMFPNLPSHQNDERI